MLVHLTLDRVVWVQVLAEDIVLCSWATHFTLTMPLSTQVYKQLPANLMLGATLRWTSSPSRWEQKYSQALHATESGIILQPYGPIGLHVDFPFYVPGINFLKAINILVHVVDQIEIQVKMILIQFEYQCPLSSDPNYS